MSLPQEVLHKIPKDDFPGGEKNKSLKLEMMSTTSYDIQVAFSNLDFFSFNLTILIQIRPKSPFEQLKHVYIYCNTTGLLPG